MCLIVHLSFHKFSNFLKGSWWFSVLIRKKGQRNVLHHISSFTVYHYEEQHVQPVSVHTTTLFVNLQHEQESKYKPVAWLTTYFRVTSNLVRNDFHRFGGDYEHLAIHDDQMLTVAFEQKWLFFFL